MCKQNTAISWVHVQSHIVNIMDNNHVDNDGISYQYRIML